MDFAGTLSYRSYRLTHPCFQAGRIERTCEQQPTAESGMEKLHSCDVSSPFFPV